eukprot:19559-Heterococcus_DN1.PRE.2
MANKTLITSCPTLAACRAKAWLQPFMTGSKMLWTDFKTMRALKQKHEENPSKLTGRERRVLRQTPLDIQLAFPLVAFSVLPIAGYLAPLIGLQFSKHLLPQQFWTSEARRKYAHQMLEEMRLSGQPHTLELLHKLGAAESSITSSNSSSTGNSSNSKVLTSVRRGMSPADVAALRPAFTAGSATALEASAHIHSNSYHLQCNTVTPVSLRQEQRGGGITLLALKHRVLAVLLRGFVHLLLTERVESTQVVSLSALQLRLSALDRAHLLHLLMRSTVSPWYKKTLAAALPASYVRSVLLQEAGLLRDDDADLLADGVDTLTGDELLHACYQRRLAIGDAPTAAGTSTISSNSSSSSSSSDSSTVKTTVNTTTANTGDTSSKPAADQDTVALKSLKNWLKLRSSSSSSNKSDSSSSKSDSSSSSIEELPPSLILHAPDLLLPEHVDDSSSSSSSTGGSDSTSTSGNKSTVSSERAPLA